MLKKNMESIIKALDKILPRPLKKMMWKTINLIIWKKIAKRIVEYYAVDANMMQYDPDSRQYIKELVRTIQKEGFIIFCCMEKDIRKRYFERKISVYKDKNVNLNYILVDNKKLYFARGMNKHDIRDYFNSLSLEQHCSSPHRYFTEDRYFIGVMEENTEKGIRSEKSFGVDKGDVVVDLGAGEGNFALSVVDLADKLYLFEADSLWCEALQATFAPYGKKVRIINKCISDKNDKDHVTIDSFLQKEQTSVNFIKFDIEGYEEAAVNGSMNMLKDSNRIKLALCTYHRPQDEKLFSEILERLGFDFYFTDGYIVYPDNKHPCIRKGLIRASKGVVL